jgi:chromosome segregation ATPase
MVTFPFQSAPRDTEPDEEQLLRLFWNRANLKKEFATLQRERERLTDRLRRQEGATLKIQQTLEQLEGMLANPEQATNVSVFYQLRGIWQHCRKRLLRFSNELRIHQEKTEYQRVLDEFEEGLNSDISAMDSRLRNAGSRVSAVNDELGTVKMQYQKLSGFWNVFRRRKISAKAESLKAACDAAQAQVERFEEAIDAIRNEPRPEFEGLSLDGRRKINLAVIAMAQELFLHFNVDEIAAQAQEASVRKVSGSQYGNIRSCADLTRSIQKVFAALETVDDLSVRVQRRSRYLARNASYRRDDDVIPLPDSFDVISLEFNESGSALTGRPLSLNVLGEEYWDVYKALLS